MAPTLEALSELYEDTKTCAKLVGLDYIEAEDGGIKRIKHGKGFSYLDAKDKAIAASIKKRIMDLVIPPAWQEVWICPSDKGHVLATGIDEKGRKQYIYHPKWRTMRDLIKFYRMIIFAQALPKIRSDIDQNLSRRKLTRQKVIAIMLWILDNAYIRIGNEAYFQENESVGLTTLTDKNIIVAGNVVTLSFKGKSGKDQQITFEHADIAKVLDELKQVRGARLFRYQDEQGTWRPIDSSDINTYLHELTGAQISAKDFRTWGGTLIAFMHLIQDMKAANSPKPDKAVVEAIDQAAAVLGNTRAVARSSYVHPHILGAYGTRDFTKNYEIAAKQRKVAGLDINESHLLRFLGLLFDSEFKLLQK